MALLRWLTFLLGSQAKILTVLLFWIFFFLLRPLYVLQGFPSIRKFWSCVAVSVFIDFPSYWQRDAPFHCIAYDFSHADWDGLQDHLRDAPWEDIFKLSASAAAREFCEWFQFIPHHNYQVKLISSPWLLGACAAAIVRKYHFICTNRINRLNPN